MQIFKQPLNLALPRLELGVLYTGSCGRTPKNVDLVCPAPFTTAEVTANGNVIICCDAWLPVPVGNVLQNTLSEIWTGHKLNTLRGTILDGTYKYCNSSTCQLLTNIKEANFFPKGHVIEYSTLPNRILFSVDSSCNLYCPSCRLEKRISLNATATQQSYNIISNVLNDVFAEPHNKHIVIGFDGSGEVFGSAVYRRIFETNPIFKNLEQWPNVKFWFMTNGVMMTEKTQRTLSRMFDKADDIHISIDAGDKESYDKVRLGGDWDLLWKNIDYLYKTLLSQRPDIKWMWQIVMQQDNYKSFPALVERAYAYSNNLPMIHISPILNWGTFSNAEFNMRAIWKSESDEYNAMQDMLDLSVVKNYPNIFNPIKPR